MDVIQQVKKYLNEKNTHLAFEVGIILKGIYAIIEIISGIVILFISQNFVQSIVYLVTQGELLEDPNDSISRFLVHSAQYFTLNSQHFASFYLLIHGIIKLFLVENLMKKRLWAYPTAIIVFVIFAIYQIYRFTHTHSVWLIIFTIFDIIVIWLTWHEYRYRRNFIHN